MEADIHCSRCSQTVTAAELRAVGKMSLCGRCLATFVAEGMGRRRLPPGAAATQASEIDLQQIDLAAGWAVARIGLTLQLVAMFAAFFGVAIVVIDVALEPPPAGSLLSLERWPRLMAGFLLMVGAGCGSYLGIALCCVLAAREPRYYARLAVSLLSAGLLLGAAGQGLRGPALQIAFILFGFASTATLAGLIIWAVFLGQVSDYFFQHRLANQVTLGFIFAPLINVMLIGCCFPWLNQVGDPRSYKTFFLFLIPAGLYLWLVSLVARVRATIPTRRP